MKRKKRKRIGHSLLPRKYLRHRGPCIVWIFSPFPCVAYNCIHYEYPRIICGHQPPVDICSSTISAWVDSRLKRHEYHFASQEPFQNQLPEAMVWFNALKYDSETLIKKLSLAATSPFMADNITPTIPTPCPFGPDPPPKILLAYI